MNKKAHTNNLPKDRCQGYNEDQTSEHIHGVENNENFKSIYLQNGYLIFLSFTLSKCQIMLKFSFILAKVQKNGI